MKCESCYEEIPAKRLAAVPNARFCVGCQSSRDEYIRPPAHVMAALSEEDDMTRVREEGWNA